MAAGSFHPKSTSDTIRCTLHTNNFFLSFVSVPYHDHTLSWYNFVGMNLFQPIQILVKNVCVNCKDYTTPPHRINLHIWKSLEVGKPNLSVWGLMEYKFHCYGMCVWWIYVDMSLHHSLFHCFSYSRPPTSVNVTMSESTEQHMCFALWQKFEKYSKIIWYK
jgi:hypothetical protein